MISDWKTGKQKFPRRLPSFALSFLWTTTSTSDPAEGSWWPFPACGCAPVNGTASLCLVMPSSLRSNMVLQSWQSVLQQLHLFLQFRHTADQGLQALQDLCLACLQTWTINQHEACPLVMTMAEANPWPGASTAASKAPVTDNSKTDASYSSQCSKNQHPAVCLRHPEALNGTGTSRVRKVFESDKFIHKYSLTSH